MAATKNGQGTMDIGPAPTNDGEQALIPPYGVEVELEGNALLLFHRYSVEAVEGQSKAPKGSAAKRRDDPESMVWRDDKGYLCLPGEYVRMSMVNAARFRQDPRSPRKSARDLYNAGIIAVTELAPIIPAGARRPVKNWQHLDRRGARVTGRVTRERPAFYAGWKATLIFEVALPEYIDPQSFHSVLSLAGRTQGVGDFRPSHGRFQVNSFKVL